jgi:hypothetical protein
MVNTIDHFNKQPYTNIIAQFSSPAEAEQAVLALKKTGFDIRKLSLVKPMLESIVGNRSRSTAVSGGDYWICLVSGVMGIFAGARLLSIDGLSLLPLIYPLMGVLIGWISAAVMGGVLELFGFLAISRQQHFKFQPPTSARDTIIWVTGSDEDILQAKQMLTTTMQSTTDL